MKKRHYPYPVRPNPKKKMVYGTLCRSWHYPHLMSPPESTPTHLPRVTLCQSRLIGQSGTLELTSEFVAIGVANGKKLAAFSCRRPSLLTGEGGGRSHIIRPRESLAFYILFNTHWQWGWGGVTPPVLTPFKSWLMSHDDINIALLLLCFSWGRGGRAINASLFYFWYTKY